MFNDTIQVTDKSEDKLLIFGKYKKVGYNVDCASAIFEDKKNGLCIKKTYIGSIQVVDWPCKNLHQSTSEYPWSISKHLAWFYKYPYPL